MKKLLIVKTGAAGDVLRTTVLLSLFSGWNIDWLVEESNSELLRNGLLNEIITNVEILKDRYYELVISLEDNVNLIEKLCKYASYRNIIGTYFFDGHLKYTKHFCDWFDMSLVSQYGISKADKLKLKNRTTYQEHIFAGFSKNFVGEKYVTPIFSNQSDLYGDIAICPKAGTVWPNKNWYHYPELIEILSKEYRVNVLPMRKTLLDHAADITNHKYVICNDSLPMHLATSLGIPNSAIFICTSPWEIFEYGLINKIVSPKIAKYFYKREKDLDAIKSLTLEDVLHSVKKHMISMGL